MNTLCRYSLTYVKRKEIKKQVVETTCGSHEKTSGGSLYEARGSCPPENIISPGKKSYHTWSRQSKYIFTLTGSKLTQTGNLMAQWLFWMDDRDHQLKLIYRHATNLISFYNKLTFLLQHNTSTCRYSSLLHISERQNGPTNPLTQGNSHFT